MKPAADSKDIPEENIVCLKHQQIDQFKWDKCIARAVNGNIYAYSWYLNIVSPEWDALILNDYEYVMPLTWRKKYGIPYLCQPPFTQQLGIYSNSILAENLVNRFLEAIPKRFRLIQLNLNALNKASHPGFLISPFLNLELDLVKSYKDIAKDYSENLKRKIKHALQSKISIVELRKSRELINIFLTHKGKDIKSLKHTDYQKLEQLVEQAGKRKAVRIMGALDEEGKLCSGAIFMLSNEKAVFLFSANNEAGLAKAAMSLIIDTFIGEHCASRVTLDFEGSNDVNLARFYRSFGASECYYPHIEQNRMGSTLMPLLRLYRKLKDDI